MNTGLDRENLIIGARQSMKALKNGKAEEIYLADDADSFIKNDFIGECTAREIKIIRYGTMAELGRDCGIDVKTAVACKVK